MRELPDWLRVLCSLIVAALLFALAYRQFSAVPKVIQRHGQAGIKRENIPPTVIGQYRASGVAFAALGGYLCSARLA